jgi:RNA recognition motif-containing protein
MSSAPADPPTKKTKKEKKRERKAAEQQALQPQQSSEAVAAASEKRARDEVARDEVDSGLRLFVGHLPQSTNEDDLRAFFPEVDKVDMMRRHDTGRFKGSAFLTFATAAGAAAALKLSGRPWRRAGADAADEKAVLVQRAAAPGEARGDGDGHANKKPKRETTAAPSLSVFVENIPADTIERSVREALGSCGKIQKVRLLPPRQSEPDQRCCFVDFQTLEASASALKLSGRTLLGRALTLSYSHKPQPPGSGGRRSLEAKKRRKAKREEQRQTSGKH